MTAGLHERAVHGSPRRWASDESGAAILEFAIVLPIIFALLAGCFELGRALLIRQAMLDGVRGSARSLARLPDPTCQPSCTPRVSRILSTAATAIAADARVPSESVRIRSRWDPAMRVVAVTADVTFHGELLNAVGLQSALALTTTHREAHVGE